MPQPDDYPLVALFSLIFPKYLVNPYNPLLGERIARPQFYQGPVRHVGGRVECLMALAGYTEERLALWNLA